MIFYFITILRCFKEILSIVSTFSRLLGALVGHHFILEPNQDIFKGGFRFPILEKVQVLDSSISLVDAGDVYLIDEGNLGRFVWVVRATNNFKTIDSAIEASLNDGSYTL